MLVQQSQGKFEKMDLVEYNSETLDVLQKAPLPVSK
jgi:hypothetical protein